jgi:aminoglycoside phosphotransferase (APT) family kinase protein
LFTCEDGLVTEYMAGMRDLTEAELHSPGAGPLVGAIATKLAKLHSLPLPAREGSSSDNGEGEGEVVLWTFMERMLERIERTPHRLPPTISAGDIRGEVRRMRESTDALGLPIVHGHGDLKPSNVMGSDDSTRVQFIDFELAGAHYRGYDLHKIFRTGMPATPASRVNLELLLTGYRDATGELLTHTKNLQGATLGGGLAPSLPMPTLAELRAEAAASEPLTWLEAAVFFWFAMAEFPSESTKWAPLALDRWSKYRATAHLIKEGGAAAVQLEEARGRAREEVVYGQL